jgi:hypothetical protein
LPTTLAKLDSITATTLARQFLPVLTTLLRSELTLSQNERQLLRSQQKCKEVSSAARSGKSLGEAPPPLVIHTLRPYISIFCEGIYYL